MKTAPERGRRTRVDEAVYSTDPSTHAAGRSGVIENKTQGDEWGPPLARRTKSEVGVAVAGRGRGCRRKKGSSDGKGAAIGQLRPIAFDFQHCFDIGQYTERTPLVEHDKRRKLGVRK